MSKRQFSLETELTAKIDDLTAKLNRANSQINNFKNNAKKGNNDVFSGIATSLEGILPAIGAVTIATTTFNGIINTTQTAGDKWAITMASAKGSLEGFYRTLGTGDWSNFITNINNGSKAAKELQLALDELFERGLSRDINSSEIDLQIAQLEQLRKVAQAKGNESDVIKYGNEIRNLEQKKLDIALRVAEKEREAFLKELKTITGIGDSDIINFLKSYNDLEIEKVRQLAIEYNKEKSKITEGEYIFNEKIGGYVKTSVDATTVEKRQKELNERYNNEVKLYAATLEAYDSLNDEKIKRAVNAEININRIQTESLKSQSRNEVAIVKATGKEIANSIPMMKLDLLVDKQKIQQDIIDTLELVEIPNLELNLTYFGLPKLENELSKLLQAQSLSSTSETYASYQLQIDEIRKKIRDFKGEVEDSNNSMDGFYSGMSSAFNSLADSADRFGNKSVAAFLNIVAATSQVMENIAKLTEFFNIATNALKAHSATQQAADAASLSSAPAKIASNQAVAISEGVKSGAGIPFPANILAITATIAAIIAAFASIKGGKKFATGGIVGGGSFTGDNILIRANSGEMVLNNSQQSRLFNILNGNGGGMTGEVTFKIDGNALVGVLNNQSKLNKLTR